MRSCLSNLRRPAVLAAIVGTIGFVAAGGCGSGGGIWQLLGTPFPSPTGSVGSQGPSSTGQTSGSQLGVSDRTPVDPCGESQARKFVTVSMRNMTPDYAHYFLVAIAFVDVDETVEGASIPFFDNTLYPDGAVCQSDLNLYRQFGYDDIPANTFTAFGDYCIGGPALIYFHRNGQFRRSAGTDNSGLGSAIAPAQGSNPTYDNFFSSAGAKIPVPDLILFHNPGTGEGLQLKISSPWTSPCDIVTIGGATVCQRDSFYYVDDRDIMAGSTALGRGSGRRVPTEIQGTGCECTGFSRAFQILAPSRVTARDANCNEFLRGGRIDYVFLRQDEDPPFPQLVWQVTDGTGGIAHEFDGRAGLP